MIKIILPLAIVFLNFSCAMRSPEHVVDRTKVPSSNAAVPASSSEIREIAFNRVAGESGHKDLHIRGMLFSKKENGGSGEIVPCSGCVVMLKGIKDTSVVVRMTTEKDGFFSFHGESGVFVLSLNNPGHNTVTIDPIEFDPGGVTSIVLVNAAGAQTERFRITHNQRVYTWTKD